MNPARMALRRPVTWIVVWLAVALAGIFAFNRIRKDIFPVLNISLKFFGKIILYITIIINI